ncbi:hypothetical protein [Parasphingorhabdus sp.]|uniref:hypothetical protein n=1 Tax=Parasphingorhabdus sp. TaxID=2709688 RepID=UPI003264559F
MSQLKLVDVRTSIKVVLIPIVVVVLASCVERLENPQTGTAQHIYVGHGSIWGGGIELELSKLIDESSIFEDSEEGSFTPHGAGRRAKLNIGTEEFLYAEKALRSLESRAFSESEIGERLMGSFTMGYDCKDRITDNTVLFVEWKYSNGETRHAFYDTGCKNSVTKQLRKSYFEFANKLRKGVSEDQWFGSMSRNVDEVVENE